MWARSGEGYVCWCVSHMCAGKSAGEDEEGSRKRRVRGGESRRCTDFHRKVMALM